MIQACQNSGVGALGSSSADMPAVHTASNSTDDKHVVLIRDHTVLLLASKPGNLFNLSGLRPHNERFFFCHGALLRMSYFHYVCI